METIKLNITQLNTLIKRIIDAEEFLQTISVYGEVSNFKISAGNAYFDIKENGAQISCVKFGAYNLDIHNGDMVLLTGRLNYYVKTGKLSFIANIIEPYGLGDLYKQFLQLKESLAKEGLFDEDRKKALPKFTNIVGVITSETGAVIRDICHVAKKNNPNTDIIVYPARVQGIGAENEVIAGLRYFENSNVDVVIIARGGGSFEDLAPFNTEKLVREIVQCKKPIISAVGHETDFSLSDFAADMRAPTPSVAGELAFFDYKQTINNLQQYINSICLSASALIQKKQDQVNDVTNLNLATMAALTDKQYLMLNASCASIQNTFSQYLQQKQASLEKTIISIEKSNPLTILKQGYIIAESKGQKISSINQLNVGDSINLTLADGHAQAQITKKENQ